MHADPQTKLDRALKQVSVLSLVSVTKSESCAMDMVSIADLVACIDHRWSPKIGDPSFMGWVTVVFYFAASIASAFAGTVRKQDKRVWVMLAVFLLLLGVNKQLDLQSALTAAGRCLAKIQGWYGQRQTVQFAFIVGLLSASALLMVIMLFRLRRSLGRVGIAVIGFGFLLTFVAVRAIGFHHFDQFINGYTGWGARMNWVMELTGIVLILINAVAATRNARSMKRNHNESRLAGSHRSVHLSRGRE